MWWAVTGDGKAYDQKGIFFVFLSFLFSLVYLFVVRAYTAVSGGDEQQAKSNTFFSFLPSSISSSSL